MHYLKLHNLLKQHNLLKRTYTYYIITSALVTLSFVATWIAIFYIQSTVARIFLAILLGIICVHFGFIAHDAGHKAITNNKTVNNLIGLITMPVINGISWQYWNNHHNEHHKDPNHPNDPDVNYLIVAFTPEQIGKNKFLRWCHKHQHKLFVPMHLFTIFSMNVSAFKYCIKKMKFGEIPLMLIHFAAWTVLPAYFIGTGQALMIFFISAITRGFYFSAVFVPNHTGMPMFKHEHKLDYFQKQILTARNLKPSMITDFMFGGLNYQIEHHIFPTLSRKNLKKAAKIVREYCIKHAISYKETTVMQSYKEILAHVKKISTLA